MTAISDKKDELDIKLTNIGNTIINSRKEIVKKMLLSEQTFDTISGGGRAILGTTIGSSGKVLHEVCIDLGKQRSILRGASSTDTLNFILPTDADFTGSIANTLKTPTSTSISYNELKTLTEPPVSKTLSNTVSSPDYFGNFFLSKDKTDTNAVFFADEKDKDHIKTPSLTEDNDVTIGYFYPEGQFRQTIPYNKLIYKNTDPEIAIIKVNNIRVGYITPLGIVRSDNITGLIIDELRSALDITKKLITLTFSDFSSASTDHLVTLHYSDNTAGEALTELDISSSYNTNTKTWSKLLIAPDHSTIEIYQNSSKIALIDENGAFIGLALDLSKSVYDKTTGNIVIKPKVATASDIIEIKHKTLTTVVSSNTIGKFDPSSTITLEDISGSTNYVFTNVDDGVPRDGFTINFSQIEQVILYNGAGGFTIGETVQGETSGAEGYITAENIGSNNLTFYQQTDTAFISGETLIGLTSEKSCIYLGDISVTDIDDDLGISVDLTGGTSFSSTYTGEHTDSSIAVAGTVNTSNYDLIEQISTLTFDNFPNKKIKIKVKYSYLSDKSTFDTTYDQVILTAQGTSTSGAEVITTIMYGSITNYVANNLGQVLYLRKLTDYSVYAQLEVSCHGLELSGSWPPADWAVYSSNGDDSTILTQAQFKALMAWMDPSGTDDLILSCNSDNVSFVPQDSYDDATVNTQHVNINKSPFFAATGGDEAARGTGLDETDMVGGNHLAEDPTDDTVLVWSMLSKQKWTYQIDVLFGHTAEVISSYSFADTLEPAMTGVIGYSFSASTTIPTSDTPYPAAQASSQGVYQYWMDSGSKKIQARISGSIPYNYGAWADFTCWWTDFVNMYLGADYIHLKEQIDKLYSLGETLDPNTDEVDDGAFWTFIGLMKTATDNITADYDEIVGIWSGIDASAFDVTTVLSGTGRAIKTTWDEFIVKSGSDNDLTEFESICFTASTGRLDILDTRIGTDIDEGYSQSIFDSLNAMVANNISYFKDPITSEGSIQAIHDDFSKNLTKWKFYDNV